MFTWLSNWFTDDWTPHPIPVLIILCVICVYGIASVCIRLERLESVLKVLAESLTELNVNLADSVSNGIRQAERERTDDIELDMLERESEIINGIARKRGSSE